jgi:hypothetical protein
MERRRKMPECRNHRDTRRVNICDKRFAALRHGSIHADGRECRGSSEGFVAECVIREIWTRHLQCA